MTQTDDHREKAERFRAMHHDGGMLVLPNAWDHASAALIADAGHRAIATTSVGYALTRGRPDGQNLSRAENIAFASELAACAPVPVTADLEAGYGDTPEAVAATVKAAIAGGLSGCNIEDVSPGSGALMDYDLAVTRIQAGAQAARRADMPFVLNARTDPFLVGFSDPEACFAEAVRRANAFLEAGAGCVYVPGVVDPGLLGRLVKAIDGPFNAHAIGGVGALSLDEYRDLGVRRLSLGGSLMMSALAHVRDTLAAIGRGDLGYAAGAMRNGEMNALMEPWQKGLD
ncbi:MAG: isocitrate lyase/PEP mutase family protein [Minwuia sp.]|uniref:isocitrate lyase/PEP mutase family protein n=1 Tax=Minwuia sp. TaxID=2493630 RepID=UPI003A8A6FB1